MASNYIAPLNPVSNNASVSARCKTNREVNFQIDLPVKKIWQATTSHRSTSYPCCVSALGRFGGSWSCSARRGKGRINGSNGLNGLNGFFLYVGFTNHLSHSNHLSRSDKIFPTTY